MAWIEERKKQYRVYWRTPTGRQYEPFKSHSDAQRFMALALNRHIYGKTLAREFEELVGQPPQLSVCLLRLLLRSCGEVQVQESSHPQHDPMKFRRHGRDRLERR